MDEKESRGLPRDDYLNDPFERCVTKLMQAECPLCGETIEVSRTFRPGKTVMAITNACLCPVAWKGEVVPAQVLMASWFHTFPDWEPGEAGYFQPIEIPDELREEPEE